MVWTGNYSAHKASIEHVLVCANCDKEMGTPLLYQREFCDHETVIQDIWIEAGMTEEALEEVMKKYSVTNQNYICGYGLINECLHCGNRPYFLKGYDSEDISVKISGGVITFFNKELDKVFLKHVSSAEAVPEGYIYISEFDESMEDDRDRARAHFMKEMLGEVEQLKHKTVDDHYNDIKKIKKNFDALTPVNKN